MSDYRAYMSMSTDEQICIDMTQKEEAAMFAAFNNGIENIGSKDYQLIQSIIDKLKEEVWPDDEY